MNQSNHIVIGISGASGVRYGVRMIEHLVKMNWQVHLMVTKSAWRVMQEEENLKGVGATSPLPYWLNISSQQAENQVTCYPINEIAARPASGTFKARAMVIIPASMKTCAAIAHGYSDDLLARCADVFLKEKRPLVVVPRETPLSAIHLRNMLTITEAGAHLVPAMPGFYCQPQSLEDLYDFMCMKIFNLLDIDHEIQMTWDGPQSGRTSRETT